MSIGGVCIGVLNRQDGRVAGCPRDVLPSPSRLLCARVLGRSIPDSTGLFANAQTDKEVVMPVFMIGTQRSGSNLLRLMLNELPATLPPRTRRISCNG